MIRIKSLTLDDGSQILVEVDQADIPAADLPDNAMDSMRRTVGGLARGLRDSFGDTQPKEWTMELGIGFKGEAQPVPVVVAGSGTGSIKVTARWKKDDD
jgi:hypothetical protein